MGDEITKLIDCVVYLSAPVDIRLSRIQKREIEKFGDRVLEGGDMYDSQKAFRDFCAARTPDKIEKWLDTLSCSVLKLDGENSVIDNINCIKSICYQ